MSDSTVSAGTESELNELISLAEKSTATMDSLASEFSQSQLQLMIILFTTVVAAFLCVMASLAALVGSFRIAGYESLIPISLSVFAVLLVAAGTYVMNSRLMNLRRVKRDLVLERVICGRLLSMIDDQYRRVRRESNLSSVALATIEIRVKRLDRSKEY